MPESRGLRCSLGFGRMEAPNRPVSPSVDLGGRLGRTANVQDHVPRFLLGRIDAKRHWSPPCPVDRRENLAETLAVLLRDVHDSEVQVEFIVRWLHAVEFQRNESVELVLELFEPILQVTEELLVLKGFERIEVWHITYVSIQRAKRFTGGLPKPCRPPPSSGMRGPRIARADRRPGPCARRNVTHAKDIARRIPRVFLRTQVRPDGCRYCPDSKPTRPPRPRHISALVSPRISHLPHECAPPQP